MTETARATIEKLETLAAWHRLNADHAGSAWIWEARLRTAEDLERQAATIRARMGANTEASACTDNGLRDPCEMTGGADVAVPG
jgi:hypothetical protein